MSDEEEYEYDDDEDYHYSDGDDDDGEDRNAGSSSYSGGGSSSSSSGGGGKSKSANTVTITSKPAIIDAEGVKQVIARRVEEVSDMLALSEDETLILCNHELWTPTSILTEKWLTDSENIMREAGLSTGGDAKSDAGESGASSSDCATPPTSFTCPVCITTLEDRTQGFALKCGHMVCNDCWSAGLKVHVSSPESLRSTCFDSCPLVVPRSVYKKFLSPEDFGKYERWQLDKFVQSSRELKNCPKPNCDAIAVSSGSTDGTYNEVNCTCGNKWCFDCKEEDHQPALCHQVQAWSDKSNNQDLTAMYIKANTKKCPKCKLEIVKDEGCQHMRCSNCGFHFCWLCLGPYSAHNESTGGFYACNKFEKRIKTEGRTEEEKRAARAAHQLKNYEMAFERHLNHRNAMEAAQRELFGQVEENLRSLSGADHVDDAHHLKAAVDQIVASRRILAWSYVYKFYQFEDESTERELQLFETYQGKLEHMTEELQTRISDMGKFRSAAGTSFAEWRQGIVHLVGAVRSFSVNVMQFAADSDCYAGAGVAWEATVKAEVDTQKERVVWAWVDDSGTWNPFSDENIRIMEEAHAAGDGTVNITSAGRRYRVDLRRMSQMNLDTHGSRTIRRTLEAGASWSCSACSYHNPSSSTECLMCQTQRDA